MFDLTELQEENEYEENPKDLEITIDNVNNTVIMKNLITKQLAKINVVYKNLQSNIIVEYYNDFEFKNKFMVEITNIDIISQEKTIEQILLLIQVLVMQRLFLDNDLENIDIVKEPYKIVGNQKTYYINSFNKKLRTFVIEFLDTTK